MTDWEGLYRALVRRLVEIADDTEAEHIEWHPTVRDYDRVTRAHEKTIELYPDDRSMSDDPLHDSLR